jgi:hypothetical protein
MCPCAASARRVRTLVLAVLVLAACGERIIIGREPDDLASSEPARDAGALPAPEPDPSFERDDEEDSGGDDDADDDADDDDGDDDDGSDDESDGDDADP